MDGFFNFFSQILRPIEWVVSWILVLAHQGLTAIGMPETSGWTWALSIVALVVCIRIVLIPLFVRQIKASRGLQLIQPEMKKIQAKYKGKSDQASKEAMTRETMALYKSSGTNPLASCLPLLLQSPIFFALFNVLNGLTRMADGTREPVGGLTRDLAAQAESSTLFGARLSETFLRTDDLNVQILTVILIVLMSATTFTTQRQLMRKNMPASSLEGNPFAQQQKILLYVLPLVFAVSGVNFPIGVLLYWLTTNVWSMGQQFFVIRRMPAPGSLAEKALNERRAKKGKPLFGAAPAEPDPEPVVEQPKGQRVQPKRRDRQRRPAGVASDAAAPTPMTARADLTKPARTGASPRPGVAAGGTGTPAKGARRKGAAQKQVRARGATAVQRSATDEPGTSSR
jgi:YidC/Oxa1 family membrane protein insertase